MPAPTQTALLHRNGNLIDREKLKRYLHIYQSSSPSYLLMAGIDEALFTIATEGFRRLDELLGLRKQLEKRAETFQHIRVCPHTEPGKLIISVKNTSVTGQELSDILRKTYHLQMEMASGSYVTAILTMMDTKEGMERLATALQEIDQNLSATSEKQLPLPGLKIHPKRVMEIYEAYQSKFEKVDLKEAVDRTAAEFVSLYPPGIPILVPGEVISERVLEIIQGYQERGYVVQGIDQGKLKVISILE